MSMARGLIHTRLHRESGTVSETGRADIAGVAIGEAHPSCDTQTACDLPTQPLLQPSTSGIVMLVLCGAPGAGKSTFSSNLMAASPKWVRVNQDTVKGGRRGSRGDCVALARSSLLTGNSVIIDRCNVEASQRLDFLQLAAHVKVQVHAIVLDLPAKVCARQAMGREQHEGGVQGAEAERISYSVVSRLHKEGLPAKAEGFSSITVCRTHKDIATALGVWKKEEIPEEPEQMYYARGGGGSRLQHYFAPVGQQALKPLSRIPPKRSPGNGHKHWGHPPEGSASCRIKAATGTPGLKDAAQPADLVGPPGSAYAIATQLLSDIPQEESMTVREDTHNGAACIPRDSTNSQEAAPSNRAVCESTVSHPVSRACGAGEKRQAVEGPGRNAFSALMSSGRAGPSTAASKKHTFARHLQDLRNLAMDPNRERQKHPSLREFDKVVTIDDKFPKARLHSLVIAKDLELEGPADLRASHIPLLQVMKEAARDLVEQTNVNLGGERVRMGFHSLPSLQQLHLHVISQDFDSPWLKNKKHWNSFTTGFFLDIDKVEVELTQNAKLTINKLEMDMLLKRDLICHKCSAPFRTMPALKSHLAQNHKPQE